MPKAKTKKFQPINRLRSPMRMANFLLVFAITGMFFLIFASAAPTPGMYGSVEKDQATRINNARTSVADLQHIECLNVIAELWTVKMAKAGGISHNPNLANELSYFCGNQWTRGGENVGVTTASDNIISSSSGLFNAFMASPGHKANILGDFTDQGVGAYVYGGKLWVTHVFAKCVGCGGQYNTAVKLAVDPKPAGTPVPTYLGAYGLKADFNGDGYSDVMWYRAGGDNDDRIWYGSATRNKFTSVIENAVGTYRPITGDFDGDGYSDILWYSPGTGTDKVWYGTATMGSFSPVNLPATNGTYIPIPGDFDGDGKSDVLYYGTGSGADYIHYGTAQRGVFNTSTDVNVSGVYTPIPGDFNGDGKSDIIWYGHGSAPDSMWYGTSIKGTLSPQALTITGSGYRPITGDFNGDSYDDIYWHGPGSINDSSWYGTATRGSFTHHAIPQISGSYIPIPGDFDGDGKGDVLFYKAGTGIDYLQSGTATKGSFSSLQTSAVNSTYSPIPF